MVIRNSFFCTLISVLVFVCGSVVSAQTSVEDAFKEDTSSGSQTVWTNNPSREDRPVAVSFEAAWNGLAGLGPIVHYYPVQHLALEGGVGLAGTGIKTGVRGRVVFGKKTASGFVGIGFSSGSGSGGTDVTVTNDNNKISFELKRTNFLQFTAGADVVAKQGFFFLGSVGWSHCLNRNNVVITSGIPTDLQEKAFDIAYRGGLILGLDFGYAFKVR